MEAAAAQARGDAPPLPERLARSKVEQDKLPAGELAGGKQMAALIDLAEMRKLVHCLEETAGYIKRVQQQEEQGQSYLPTVREGGLTVPNVSFNQMVDLGDRIHRLRSVLSEITVIEAGPHGGELVDDDGRELRGAPVVWRGDSSAGIALATAAGAAAAAANGGDAAARAPSSSRPRHSPPPPHVDPQDQKKGLFTNIKEKWGRRIVGRRKGPDPVNIRSPQPAGIRRATKDSSSGAVSIVPLSDTDELMISIDATGHPMAMSMPEHPHRRKVVAQQAAEAATTRKAVTPKHQRLTCFSEEDLVKQVDIKRVDSEWIGGGGKGDCGCKRAKVPGHNCQEFCINIGCDQSCMEDNRSGTDATDLPDRAKKLSKEGLMKTK